MHRNSVVSKVEEHTNRPSQDPSHGAPELRVIGPCHRD